MVDLDPYQAMAFAISDCRPGGRRELRTAPRERDFRISIDRWLSRPYSESRTFK